MVNRLCIERNCGRNKKCWWERSVSSIVSCALANQSGLHYREEAWKVQNCNERGQVRKNPFLVPKQEWQKSEK